MEDTLQDLKIINHCCVHMTRLIDDILTLSKLGKCGPAGACYVRQNADVMSPIMQTTNSWSSPMFHVVLRVSWGRTRRRH